MTGSFFTERSCIDCHGFGHRFDRKTYEALPDQPCYECGGTGRETTPLGQEFMRYLALLGVQIKPVAR